MESVRPDGSWPIDTNLATWVTTLASTPWPRRATWSRSTTRGAVLDWLLKQQYKERHPYTGADPGGWAWTDLPGGVPDADDTPGAFLAGSSLAWSSATHVDRTLIGGPRGVDWLLDLQNRDGGWPTFCRGWGTLAV